MNSMNAPFNLWYVVMSLFYVLMPIAGLIIGIRYMRLSRHMPLLITGFGLMLAMQVVTRVINMSLRPIAAGPILSWQLVYTLSSGVGGVIAWALVIGGMGMVLEDLSQRMHYLNGDKPGIF